MSGSVLRRPFATVVAVVIVMSLPAAARAGEKLPTTRVSVPGSLGAQIEFVRVPGGKVTILTRDDKDDKGKPREFEIKPFWIARYELRWSEYTPYYARTDLTDEQRRNAVDADSRPSRPYSLPHRASDEEAACGVHLRPARGYCDWLSGKTGKRFRLPTEAEWEWACRAGGAEPAPATKKALEEVAWFADNAQETAHEVGGKRANAWGLHDMLGNVGEWVTRGHDPGAKWPSDVGHSVPVSRAWVAGGSFQDVAADVRPDARDEYARQWQRDDPQEPKSPWWICNGFHVGFRVVMQEESPVPTPVPGGGK